MGEIERDRMREGVFIVSNCSAASRSFP